jgi:hypothetical protein
MSFVRLHTVERYCVGVAEAVTAELLDLLQPNDLVPLGSAKQEVAVVGGEYC